MISPVAVYFERCEPNWSFPQSVTQNHILLLVTDGSFTYVANGEELSLISGDVLYVPKGTVRSGKNRPDQPHHMYVAHFSYEGDGDKTSILREGCCRHLKLFNADYLKHRFSLLTQHWLRKTKYYEAICHGILLEMLAIVNDEADAHQLPTATMNLVMLIQEYIVNHYRERITVAALAKQVDRTPNYISAVFRQATGQTITEYIQQIRINAARDLLINSQMTIGEISEYLGFCEQSHFNKVFKKLTGVPPSTHLKEKTKVWRE
ncbi:AraC family transcriptional regulator [Paenibacillus hodogayensis]|uniref:AraC family transcriptional regulator n=1 Tax=Paenibacillus hodogayensis TaxID=279208 RepID=A0ABV5W724_9BACL